MKPSARFVSLLLLAALVAGCQPATQAPQKPPAPPAKAEAPPAATAANRWEPEVLAFEKKDRASPPAQGTILFLGSSTIRMWSSIQEDFRPMTAIARGIGGCQIADLTYYVDRMVVPYRPRTIVFYAGDNDIAAGRPANQIYQDFRVFADKVRKVLPGTRILFISIKPSPSRERFWPEAQKANRMIRDFARLSRNIVYVDTATPMLGPDGKPRPELFLSDLLHLNRAGYELWAPIIKAALEGGTR